MSFAINHLAAFRQAKVLIPDMLGTNYDKTQDLFIVACECGGCGAWAIPFVWYFFPELMVADWAWPMRNLYLTWIEDITGILGLTVFLGPGEEQRQIALRSDKQKEQGRASRVVSWIGLDSLHGLSDSLRVPAEASKGAYGTAVRSWRLFYDDVWGRG